MSAGPSVTAALLAVLVWYRREFYAVGDPRTRWRALAVLGGLVLADIAIGLSFIMLTSGPEARTTRSCSGSSR